MNKSAGFFLLLVLIVCCLLYPTAFAQQHPPSISGTWQSNVGLVYEITCSANTFTWKVKSTGETAQGKIQGERLFASWRNRRGEQTAQGLVSEVDSQGKALRIEWSNGFVFSRSFASQSTKPAVKAPVLGKIDQKVQVKPVEEARIPKEPGKQMQDRMPDISGEWFSNRGGHYMFDQRGTTFRMVNLENEQVMNGRIEDRRVYAIPESGGNEIIGNIIEVDPEGRAHILEWPDGLVLAREPFGHAGSEPERIKNDLRTSQPLVLDISGLWMSSIKKTYEILQQGRNFNWSVRETDEKAAGMIYGDEVVVEWSGRFGSGHAEGHVIEREDSGRALRIEWSNGVIFTREALQESVKTASKIGAGQQKTHKAGVVETPELAIILPDTLKKLIPHLSLKTVYDQWVKVGGPIGGLGYDVRYLMNNARGRNVMFVTDNYSGVNKSVDGGRNWFASNKGIDARFGVSSDAIPVFSLTVDPNNPSIVWAGMKDVIGVYKSTDSGMNWVKYTPQMPEKQFVFRGFTVMPGDSNTVFAAGELPMFTQGKIFDKVKGRIYVTRDGGERWKKVWEVNDLVRYVIINPVNQNILYASCGIFDREASNSNCKSPTLMSPALDSSWTERGGVGVLRSVDGGQTWQELNRSNGLNDLYVGSLVMHPNHPEILLAGCGNNAASPYFVDGEIRYTGGVFLTTDAGNTWRQTLTNDVITSVEFSPSHPNIAYAGGRQRFYRSENGGRSWFIVSGQNYPWGPPGVIAGFPIDILVDPVDPNTLFANNYGGGNVMSRDGGKTWTMASQGYTGALMFDLSVHPANPDIVYASARSGLFMTSNGGLKWEGLSYPPARLPETYSVVIHPKTPQIVLASQELGGTVYRSKNGGKTWLEVFGLPIDKKNPLDAHGFKRMVFAPSAPHVVYGAACRGSNYLMNHPTSFGIFKSMRGGAAGSWQAANDPQTKFKSVNDLAVHPNNHNVVYAATVKGLYKTVDGGVTWVAPKGLQNSDVRAVAVDPSNSRIVYAGVDHGGVFRSSDEGATWQKMASGMDANEPIWTIVVDTGNPKILWAGSQRSGVFRWDPIEQQWIKINKGLRTKAVVDLEISTDGNVLYAATTGEGVFRYHKRF